MSLSPDAIQQTLDPDRLLDAARQATGLSDFGDLAFMVPLQIFLETSSREIPFSEESLVVFIGDVQRVLINRLRMQQDIVDHPEILDEDVSDPIFIVGLVRTGTTKLHRLLASDTGFQSIPLWQILFPSRFPGTEFGKPDPRPEFVMQAGGFVQGPVAQAMLAAHSMGIDVPDEDIILFENTFEHLYLYLRNPIHSYWEWIKSRPARPGYEMYKLLLKYLQWQNGGKRGRPWVLKCTSHAAELDILFDLFPQATVVQCHRDPLVCLPSYSKLQELMWTLRGEPIPAKTVGNAMLDAWGHVIRRSVVQRERLESGRQIVDVRYADIKDDSISVARRIYAAAGRVLTPQAEENMKQWEQNNQQHQFGRHVYSAEDFEFTRDLINKEFATYLARFSQYL